MDPARLRRHDRQRLAVQLVALASLLAEFDLWPGRTAIRSATCVQTPEGPLARVSAQPMSLSTVQRRLGGASAASERARDALLAAISRATGLAARQLRHDPTEPGFFLLPVLQRLLGELETPLDRVTARCLWAVRWDLPPLPDPGETAYWAVTQAGTARRLAAAACAALRSRGRLAWYRQAHQGSDETAPLPAFMASGTLVVLGTLSSDELYAIDRWVDRSGGGAVAVGCFPRGWEPPPPPVYDPERPGNHLAITGVSLDHARSELERRRGWFHPLQAEDRRALTDSATWLFASQQRSAGPASTTTAMERLLRLNTEGLPEAFLVLHSGLGPASVRQVAAHLRAVERDGRWRLAEPRRLHRDPLHREVAALYAHDDPRRLLHLALAGGSCEDLLEWSRARLDALDNEIVRDVLCDLEPGALGNGVQEALAEACLAELDLTGGRQATAGITGEARRAFQAWVDAVDSPPGWRPELPPEEIVSLRPRVWAEVAIAALRRGATAANQPAAAVLDRCISLLRGVVRRWYRLERAAYLEPAALRDSQWRREVLGSDLRLRRQWLHRRALQLDNAGRGVQTRRLLQRLTREETSPGRLGLVHLDLGSQSLGQGRSDDAELHSGKAFRFLQVAGFRWRSASAMFNLAVVDLDRLHVERARARLERADGGRRDHFYIGERARLALAIGDEEELFARIEELPSPRTRESRVTEGHAFLHGVAAMLRRDVDGAHRWLEAGGEEAAAWLELLHALCEEPAPERAASSDGWGVRRAASWCRRLRRDPGGQLRGRLPEAARMDVQDALAMALLERFAGVQDWLAPAWRSAAAERLGALGLIEWSRRLRSHRRGQHEVLELFARMVDSEGLTALADEQVEPLLGRLGVSGLEVVERHSGRLAWRWGAGQPGVAVVRGSLEIVPLGGAAVEGPEWDLLLGLVQLLTPPLPAREDPEVAATGFVGSGPAAAALRRELRQAAPSRLAVVLRGETGSGKDVAARAIHRLSARTGRFIPVNVAEISASLIETELFGALPGAFTGASRQARKGMATAADRGTLFLDEIGDLELPVQVKLLRFLESGEVRPVGSDRSHQVDVRIVSATHRNLEAMVAEGRFRQDLYFRLCQLPIVVPPLRDRREDILELRELFEREAVARDKLQAARWSPEADEALLGHSWPGNARELRSRVMAALVRCGGGVVQPADLQLEARSPPRVRTWGQALARCRRELIEGALEHQQGNRSAAARELGISRQTLLHHIRHLGIVLPPR